MISRHLLALLIPETRPVGPGAKVLLRPLVRLLDALERILLHRLSELPALVGPALIDLPVVGTLGLTSVTGVCWLPGLGVSLLLGQVRVWAR